MLMARTPGAIRHVQSALPSDQCVGKHIEAQWLDVVILQVINHFLAEREEQDNWAPKTVNLTRPVLHSLFAYAARQYEFSSSDRLYPNPADGVARRPEPAPQIRFLSLEQIEEQLSILEGHRTIQTMVAATYICAGLRREGACWLNRDDVDLEQRLVRIRAKTVDGHTWQPKTKRNRVVPISDALPTEDLPEQIKRHRGAKR
jgi:integrase